MFKHLKQTPKWVWQTVIGIGAIVGMIVQGMQYIENDSQQRVDTLGREVKTSIENITNRITGEIDKQTSTIAEFYEDDLYERIIILETKIDEMKENGKHVPREMIITLKSMKERLSKFKTR